MLKLFHLVPLLVASHCFSAEVREETVAIADAKFRVVRLPAKTVSLIWKDGGGEIFRTFDRVQQDFGKSGKTVKFLMNAGIFEPGGIPSGLHIEGGKQLRPLNFADAPGNFFLKPNGVVSLGRDGAFIGTSESWQERAEKLLQPETWALQSGPMLLINGERHPAFRKGSENKLHRNGVGIDREGRLVFAITASRESVNLWDFAGLFLHLGCRDALFLDGDISQMLVNPDTPVESNRFGAMFIVAE